MWTGFPTLLSAWLPVVCCVKTTSDQSRNWTQITKNIPWRNITIVSKKFIVTAAEIFYTDDTELEEAWKQPDAWQVIPAFETGYKNIKRYDPDENMFKWIDVIRIDIHPEYCDGSHDCAKSIRYAESSVEEYINKK